MSRLMEQQSFQRLYDASTQDEKQRLGFIVDRLSKKDLDAWINNHSSIDIGELTIRQLRERASKARVAGYSRLDKSNLVRRLREHQSLSA